MNMDEYHLRLFLTPKCNLRCIYCNDKGIYQPSEIINTHTVKRVLEEAISLGIKRAHYTGGEPTLRQDLPDLIEYATSLGFEEQVITTNGILFHRYAQRLKEVGLSRVTISLDTLDPKKFTMITSVDGFKDVMMSISETLRLWGRVKTNTVLMRINFDEFEDFITLSEKYGGNLTCRFIELNPNNPAFFWNVEYLASQRVNRVELFDSVSAKYGRIQKVKRTGENPNSEYYLIERTGIVFGVITNPSLGYLCGNCHKIRISPYGEIGYCIGTDKIKIERPEDIRQILEHAINKRETMKVTDRQHLSSLYGHWRFGDLSTGDHTLYIIKPDAYSMREKILEEFTRGGFKILSKTDVILNPETVKKFYAQEDEELVSFLVEYMGNCEVQVGILEKSNAIPNFIQLAGWMADPRRCDKSSIRYKYGRKKPLVRGGRTYYYNAIHRTVQNLEREIEIYWDAIKHPDILIAVKQLVTENADSVERIRYHIDPVVKNGMALADKYGASRPIIEIACYLHDITRMTGDRDDHHISGAKVAEDLLSKFNYPEERIEIIKQCILNHRGDANEVGGTIEERIVATADAMAHIQYPLPLFYTFFGKRNLSMEVGREQMIKKLEKSWKKIYFPEVQDELRERYNYLIQILRFEYE